MRLSVFENTNLLFQKLQQYFFVRRKNAASTRLKIVNSSDDNVKQASKLSRLFRKEKSFWKMLTEVLKRNISDDHHSN